MRLVWLFCCILLLVMPVSALDIQAPKVPATGADWMPRETGNLQAALAEMMEKALSFLGPGLKEASGICIKVVTVVLLVSVLQSFSGSVTRAANLVGVISLSTLLLQSTNTHIHLGADTVCQISEYAKLLLPVMTTAMAAQGALTSAGALYAGTALFNAVLTGILSKVLIPGIWLYLALAVGSSATGEDLLKKMGESLRAGAQWMLKTLLICFTSYLGITGVVSGNTDVAAIKAARVTISSVVPVVGGVLSDASEAVLVSTGLLRSAAGVYGILAVLAVFLGPFLKIGCHYLMLKLMEAVCALFAGKAISGLIGSFCTAMGLLLAMTGTSCIMLLISTVCFMRGTS